VDTGDCIHTTNDYLMTFPLQAAISTDLTLIAILCQVNQGYSLQIRKSGTGSCIQNVSIPNASISSAVDLEFDKQGAHIHLDTATIAVKGGDGSTGCPHLDLSQCSAGYGVSEDSGWITWNGNEFFRLPLDYRPLCWAISGSTGVLGCLSGRVIIMRFAVDGLMG
jgi:hypothetical protein